MNEYSVAIQPFDGNIKNNFIKFDDNAAMMSVEIKIPKRIPGHYTIMSEIIDVFGQPILELNWNFQATTGDFAEDEIIRRHQKHEPWQHLEAQLASNLWAKSLKVAKLNNGLGNWVGRVNSGYLVIYSNEGPPLQLTDF